MGQAEHLVKRKVRLQATRTTPSTYTQHDLNTHAIFTAAPTFLFPDAHPPFSSRPLPSLFSCPSLPLLLLCVSLFYYACPPTSVPPLLFPPTVPSQHFYLLLFNLYTLPSLFYLPSLSFLFRQHYPFISFFCIFFFQVTPFPSLPFL